MDWYVPVESVSFCRHSPNLVIPGNQQIVRRDDDGQNLDSSSSSRCDGLLITTNSFVVRPGPARIRAFVPSFTAGQKYCVLDPTIRDSTAVPYEK